MVDGPDCKVNMECVFVTCKEIPAPNKALSHFFFFIGIPLFSPEINVLEIWVIDLEFGLMV